MNAYTFAFLKSATCVAGGAFIMIHGWPIFGGIVVFYGLSVTVEVVKG